MIVIIRHTVGAYGGLWSWNVTGRGARSVAVWERAALGQCPLTSRRFLGRTAERGSRFNQTNYRRSTRLIFSHAPQVATVRLISSHEPRRIHSPMLVNGSHVRID